MQSGTFSRTIIDDNQPGGPIEHAITCEGSSDLCSLKKDYATFWAEFERRFVG